MSTAIAKILAELDLILNVAPTDECIRWQGRRDKAGYGRFQWTSVHRLAYEYHVGPVPLGMSVDHICFDAACYNPRHLRVLTISENSRLTRRLLQTHCKRGHEYTPENTYIYVKPRGRGQTRMCRTCMRATNPARQRARMQKLAALPPEARAAVAAKRYRQGVSARERRQARTAEENTAALARSCPQCSRAAGEWCIRTTSKGRADYLHSLRMDAR